MCLSRCQLGIPHAIHGHLAGVIDLCSSLLLWPMWTKNGWLGGPSGSQFLDRRGAKSDNSGSGARHTAKGEGWTASTVSD